MAVELDAHELAEVGIDVGRTSESCSTWVTASPQFVSASAISSPTYPAPTITARRTWRFWRVRISANVSPIVCRRCTPSLGPRCSSPPIGGRTGTAPVPITTAL